MLSFIKIQKSTVMGKLTDIVKRDSYYNSMVFTVPLHHKSFPRHHNTQLPKWQQRRSGENIELGLGKTCATYSYNPNANPLDTWLFG